MNSLITINHQDPINTGVEILKIIIPPFFGALIAIFTIWWAQKKEMERLKINKDLELEKDRNGFLFEKKYNAFSKYLTIFDEYWNASQNVLLELDEFNKKEHSNKSEFENHKNIILDLNKKFIEIQKYLSMPGLEILLFMNNQISNKVNEIVDLEEKESLIINDENSLRQNSRKIAHYIKLLSELATLLGEDLKLRGI